MLKLIILLTSMAMNIALAQNKSNDAIYYVSLNYAIQEGQFDGITTVKNLKAFGDFGLGSEEKLAGELVVLDGQFHSIPSTGKSNLMNDGDKISFAAIKFFNADTSFKIENQPAINTVENYLDARIDQNSFIGIKITGKFRSIELRSFVEQSAPYKPVDQVEEIKFRHENIEGTIVGFFTPKSAQVLNSPNYHFHFIAKNGKTGGHVLDCNIESATVELDYADELHVLLPKKKVVEHVDLNEPIKPKEEK